MNESLVGYLSIRTVDCGTRGKRWMVNQVRSRRRNGWEVDGKGTRAQWGTSLFAQ